VDPIAGEKRDVKMRDTIRRSLRGTMRLRPNPGFDNELVYERELLPIAEREVVRARSAENAVLLATLDAALEEGTARPPVIWWDQHSATPATRFSAAV
jgi:hypothetical protein